MHSPLIEQFLTYTKATKTKLPILDLACGQGRNGLFCVNQGYRVKFADKNAESLAQIKQQTHGENVKVWQIDLESGEESVLQPNAYSALIVFRYLHRPLMTQIKAAVAPGGYIVYETFTVDNRQFGRPNSSDFLLEKGELFNYFNDWQTLHRFEGECLSETSGKKQAVARLIARKP